MPSSARLTTKRIYACFSRTDQVLRATLVARIQGHVVKAYIHLDQSYDFQTYATVGAMQPTLEFSVLHKQIGLEVPPAKTWSSLHGQARGDYIKARQEVDITAHAEALVMLALEMLPAAFPDRSCAA